MRKNSGRLKYKTVFHFFSFQIKILISMLPSMDYKDNLNNAITFKFRPVTFIFIIKSHIV